MSVYRYIGLPTIWKENKEIERDVAKIIENSLILYCYFMIWFSRYLEKKLV